MRPDVCSPANPLWPGAARNRAIRGALRCALRSALRGAPKHPDQARPAAQGAAADRSTGSKSRQPAARPSAAPTSGPPGGPIQQRVSRRRWRLAWAQARSWLLRSATIARASKVWATSASASRQWRWRPRGSQMTKRASSSRARWPLDAGRWPLDVAGVTDAALASSPDARGFDRLAFIHGMGLASGLAKALRAAGAQKLEAQLDHSMAPVLPGFPRRLHLPGLGGRQGPAGAGSKQFDGFGLAGQPGAGRLLTGRGGRRNCRNRSRLGPATPSSEGGGYLCTRAGNRSSPSRWLRRTKMRSAMPESTASSGLALGQFAGADGRPLARLGPRAALLHV